jgi:hypothetical protein
MVRKFALIYPQNKKKIKEGKEKHIAIYLISLIVAIFLFVFSKWKKRKTFFH